MPSSVAKFLPISSWAKNKYQITQNIPTNRVDATGFHHIALLLLLFTPLAGKMNNINIIIYNLIGNTNINGKK